MKNPLDKLFKEKLVDHSVPPPANTWSRIEVGLPKKNNGFFRLRVAAVLLLLSALASTIVWLTSSHGSSPKELTQHVPVNKQEAPTETPPVKIELKKTAGLSASKNSRKTTLRSQKVENVITPIDEKQTITWVEPPVQDQTTDTKTESEVNPVEETKPVAIQEIKEKPIVIEYHLETITTPPAGESLSVASAKERSGFRKVIDFAIGAKNSSPLGDLREMKDELFAFNKKEKQNAK